MPPPSRSRGRQNVVERPGAGPAARPRNDAYVGLLALSFLSLVGACVLLYLDLSYYGGETKPPAAPKIELIDPSKERAVDKPIEPEKPAEPTPTPPEGEKPAEPKPEGTKAPAFRPAPAVTAAPVPPPLFRPVAATAVPQAKPAVEPAVFSVPDKAAPVARPFVSPPPPVPASFSVPPGR